MLDLSESLRASLDALHNPTDPAHVDAVLAELDRPRTILALSQRTGLSYSQTVDALRNLREHRRRAIPIEPGLWRSTKPRRFPGVALADKD